jgi:hypothetical protein
MEEHRDGFSYLYRRVIGDSRSLMESGPCDLPDDHLGNHHHPGGFYWRWRQQAGWETVKITVGGAAVVDEHGARWFYISADPAHPNPDSCQAQRGTRGRTRCELPLNHVTLDHPQHTGRTRSGQWVQWVDGYRRNR